MTNSIFAPRLKKTKILYFPKIVTIMLDLIYLLMTKEMINENKRKM